MAFILKGPALCLCPRFVFWAASVHICLLLCHPEERSRKLRLPGRSKQEMIFGCAAELLMFVDGDTVVYGSREAEILRFLFVSHPFAFSLRRDLTALWSSTPHPVKVCSREDG